MRTWKSTSAPLVVEREVVADRLGAVRLDLGREDQLGLHCAGDVVVVVLIAWEVQLGGQQLVTGRRHLHVEVGRTPRMPTCGSDQLSAGAIGRNLVRRRANRRDLEGAVFPRREAAAQVPLRDAR